MRWYRGAVPIILALGMALLVLAEFDVLGTGVGAPGPTQSLAPTANAVVRQHDESLRDMTPQLEQERFLRAFVAAGRDASQLQVATLPMDGFQSSPDLAALRSNAVAVVRGTVIEQTFVGRAGSRDGIAQYFCYAVSTIALSEVTIGMLDNGATVRVVQGSCPRTSGGDEILVQLANDPFLKNGSDCVLFLREGDDSSWANSGFPEGHRDAGPHYHLEDPSAQWSVAGGAVFASDLAPAWSRGLSGTPLATFSQYVVDPGLVPVPLTTD